MIKSATQGPSQASSRSHPWEGKLIAINKPSGWTSFQVVKAVRKALGNIRVGHGGTLDPIAEGVLILGIGRQGTRQLACTLADDKEYLAEVLLGISTDTDDITGRVIFKGSVDTIDRVRVEEVLKHFIGPIVQRAPYYSALKYRGKPYYRWVREGVMVEPPLRQVYISSIELLELKEAQLIIRVVCSKGTYIRSLARDIGDQLGCGGCLKSLVRTRVGEWSIDQALTLNQVLDLAKTLRVS